MYPYWLRTTRYSLNLKPASALPATLLVDHHRTKALAASSAERKSFHFFILRNIVAYIRMPVHISITRLPVENSNLARFLALLR